MYRASRHVSRSSRNKNLGNRSRNSKDKSKISHLGQSCCCPPNKVNKNSPSKKLFPSIFVNKAPYRSERNPEILWKWPCLSSLNRSSFSCVIGRSPLASGATSRWFVLLQNSAINRRSEPMTFAPKGGIQGRLVWNAKPKLPGPPLCLSLVVWRVLGPLKVQLATFPLSYSHLAITCKKFAHLCEKWHGL